ncbi:MAG: glycerol-3-phosphate dehydrogenase/oxidase [Nevskiales bacterium]|nr:glycerol-3-phosphate dehydrogenase/oxidase [Nevskiales bacterium]
MPRTELSQLRDQYDLIVIGGGITGAGVFREAVRSGLRVLLVEANDFASATSSWSSKLVHGGLRYLKNGQWRLTLESVRERQRLMREGAGLVEMQPFMMPIYRGRKPGRWLMRIGLAVYDLMAGARRSRWVDADAALAGETTLRRDGLLGAVTFEDARTDDARLVLRLVLDAIGQGGTALNYVRAEVCNRDGRVSGVILTDQIDGQRRTVDARMVVNAGGVWAGTVPGAPEGAPKLRPLRGSHLVFAAERLPLRHAVSWLHPRDERPIFAYPWEGAVICGTTDLDHQGAFDRPAMSPDEAAYLVEGLAFQFPELRLRAEDAIATYSGVRPVVDGGKAKPSDESRESAMWTQPGMVGITGGKLTTFAVTARQVLRAAARELPELAPGPVRPVFAETEAVVEGGRRRLRGRLGGEAAQRLSREMPADEQQAIGDTLYSWAEVRWAARHEMVTCLQDVMMRRTRLGLVTPEGGEAWLERVAAICAEELGWDAQRRVREIESYRAYWRRQHAPVH